MPIFRPTLPVFERYVEIPLVAPIQLVDKNRTLDPSYHIKHFDAWLAEEQLLENETAQCWHQPWQKKDIVFMQLISSFGPIRVSLRNSRGVEVLQQQMQQVGSGGGFGRTYWQNQISLESFPEGFYKVYYYFGDPVQIILEGEVWDVRDDHPGTILMKYSNNFNNQVFWESGIYMTLRVDGVVAEYLPVPAPGRTVYVDQPGRAKTVRGGSARQFQAIYGNRIGVPPWVADKLEEIYNQNNLQIDGKAFSADAGAKLAPKRIDRYGLAQWSIDIREADASRVKRFTSTGILEQKFVEDVVVDGKLFGALGGSSNDNTYVVLSVQ